MGTWEEGGRKSHWIRCISSENFCGEKRYPWKELIPSLHIMVLSEQILLSLPPQVPRDRMIVLISDNRKVLEGIRPESGLYQLTGRNNRTVSNKAEWQKTEGKEGEGRAGKPSPSSFSPADELDSCSLLACCRPSPLAVTNNNTCKKEAQNLLPYQTANLKLSQKVLS